MDKIKKVEKTMNFEMKKENFGKKSRDTTRMLCRKT